MSNLVRPMAGPRRLILIQSGKYDYAELDLTESFQLVGVNGLGKTALISTLQYLYLDSQRDMRFGQHSTEESRRFYFRGEASFILFECETSIGTVTLGARSLGATAGYELQRFAWSGAYQRDDFIDEDGRPKRWDEVRLALGTKELKLLPESVDLRRLLGAVDADTTMSWGLVPLADARDYPRFRQTFQRLLQLRDIRQDDLKQLLADCAKLGPSQREIDLAKDFEKELGRISGDREEVSRLRKAESLVQEVRALFDKEYVARAIAHAVTKELQAGYSDHAASYKRAIDALIAVRDESNREHKRLESVQEELKTILRIASAEVGRIQGELNELSRDRERFATFVLDIEEQVQDRLGDEILDLHSKLKDLPTESVEVLERHLELKRSELTHRERAAARLSDLFITWLRQRLPEKSIARLGALFDRSVLESLMDEQIHINDEAALIERLKAAVERCDARGYEDDAVAVEYAPGALSTAGKIGVLDQLQEDIQGLKGEVQRLERNIDTLRNAKPMRERLPVAKREHANQIRLLSDYRRFSEHLEKAGSLDSELVKKQELVAGLEEEQQANEQARSKVQLDGLATITKFDKANDDDRAIRKEALNMPLADGDDPGPKSVSEAFVRDLPESLLDVFQIVRGKCADARQKAQALSDKVGLLDRDFVNPTFRYDLGASVEDRLRQLETEIASLPARSQHIETRWLAILTEAKRSFHTVLKSLDAVKKEVRKLNSELAGIEFSSIAEVKLEVVPNQAAVGEYERHAKDSAQPSLFDAVAEADLKMDQFAKLLQQRPKLVLNDLFSLRCEVRRKDGQKNFYDDFDQVESTGTTIVLKVTLNLLVLRDLLIPGKARIPFYLDEVHALDRQNFNNILQLSERLGFVGIYAAPTAAIGPRRFVHLVPDVSGRLVVTSAHQKDIVRAPDDEPVAE